MYKIISKKEYNDWQEKITILQNQVLRQENYINLLEKTNQEFLDKIKRQQDELKNNKFKWS